MNGTLHWMLDTVITNIWLSLKSDVDVNYLSTVNDTLVKADIYTCSPGWENLYFFFNEHFGLVFVNMSQNEYIKTKLYTWSKISEVWKDQTLHSLHILMRKFYLNEQ